MRRHSIALFTKYMQCSCTVAQFIIFIIIISLYNICKPYLIKCKIVYFHANVVHVKWHLDIDKTLKQMIQLICALVQTRNGNYCEVADSVVDYIGFDS